MSVSVFPGIQQCDTVGVEEGSSSEVSSVFSAFEAHTQTVVDGEYDDDDDDDEYDGMEDRLPSPLLRDGDAAQVTESYASSEDLLNKFLRLHPMLSMEATDAKVLAAVCAPTTGRSELLVHVLPIVSKSYEDSMLRPARIENGERSCTLGAQCLCTFIAKVRYGANTDKGFVGVEFLLPSEREAWRNGTSLPDRAGKCLICLRYFTTYCHALATSDPTFYSALQRGTVRAQTHANAELNMVVDAETGVGQLKADGSPLPSHASAINCRDGYASSALLEVHDSLANTRMGRETSMGSILWQPIVRFSSAHLRYERDADTGEPRLVQVGIGHDVVTRADVAPLSDGAMAHPTDANHEASNGQPSVGEVHPPTAIRGGQA
jgi:hypothetical protein